MSSSASKNTLRRDLMALVLRPVVAYAVRKSWSIQDFVALAKELFVECADLEIRKTSDKVNISRISIMTGIYRKDVDRIYNQKSSPEDHTTSLLTRIVGQWQQDRRFCTKSGSPRVLKYKGEGSDFHKLVNSVSVSIKPGTVAFELKRTGLAVETPRGLKLEREMFGFSGDARSSFNILSDDINTLINTVEENVIGAPDYFNLHARTEYDNVLQSALPEIRVWLAMQGKDLHRRAREFISRFDKDVNEELEEKGGGRVVLGAFGHVEPSGLEQPMSKNHAA